MPGIIPRVVLNEKAGAKDEQFPAPFSALTPQILAEIIDAVHKYGMLDPLTRIKRLTSDYFALSVFISSEMQPLVINYVANRRGPNYIISLTRGGESTPLVMWDTRVKFEDVIGAVAHFDRVAYERDVNELDGPRGFQVMNQPSEFLPPVNRERVGTRT